MEHQEVIRSRVWSPSGLNVLKRRGKELALSLDVHPLKIQGEDRDL